ncbi:MAG: DUF1918 domain-containing protein [Acidimicrobiales bacterium]
MSPGDRLLLPPRVRGDSPRIAVIVEVLGANGSPPFHVCWPDGSQSIVYPSTDAHLLRAGPSSANCRSTER